MGAVMAGIDDGSPPPGNAPAIVLLQLKSEHTNSADRVLSPLRKLFVRV